MPATIHRNGASPTARPSPPPAASRSKPEHCPPIPVDAHDYRCPPRQPGGVSIGHPGSATPIRPRPRRPRVDTHIRLHTRRNRVQDCGDVVDEYQMPRRLNDDELGVRGSGREPSSIRNRHVGVGRTMPNMYGYSNISEVEPLRSSEHHRQIPAPPRLPCVKATPILATIFAANSSSRPDDCDQPPTSAQSARRDRAAPEPPPHPRRDRARQQWKPAQYPQPSPTLAITLVRTGHALLERGRAS